MRCENCALYRKRNDVEGECMLNPPVPLPTSSTRATPDAWVRPLVYHDDYCDSFKVAAKKRGRPKGSTKGGKQGELDLK